MAKYDPLSRYLRTRTADTWPMTFDDIERVLNAMLPNSAARADWWKDDLPDGPSVQARAWTEAGFNAEFMRDGHILFRRRV